MPNDAILLILVGLAITAVVLFVRANRSAVKDQPQDGKTTAKLHGRPASGTTHGMSRPLPQTPAERRMPGSFHHTRPQDRETLAQAQRRRGEEERRRRDSDDIPMTDVRHPLHHTLYGMPAHDDRSSRANDRSCDDARPSHSTHDDRPAYCPDPAKDSHSYGGSSSDSYGGSSSSSSSSSSSYGGSDSSSSSSSSD